MLTKGIVEKLIDSYRIKVRIPVYNKPSYVNGATITNDLYEACICTLPNCSMNLQVGDIVILGFEDNDIAQPIILGCLYAKDINYSKTDLVVSSIEALNSVNLPQDTYIGNVTPTDLGYLTGLKSNVQGQIDVLNGIQSEQTLKWQDYINKTVEEDLSATILDIPISNFENVSQYRLQANVFSNNTSESVALKFIDINNNIRTIFSFNNASSIPSDKVIVEPLTYNNSSQESITLPPGSMTEVTRFTSGNNKLIIPYGDCLNGYQWIIQNLGTLHELIGSTEFTFYPSESSYFALDAYRYRYTLVYKSSSGYTIELIAYDSNIADDTSDFIGVFSTDTDNAGHWEFQNVSTNVSQRYYKFYSEGTCFNNNYIQISCVNFSSTSSRGYLLKDGDKFSDNSNNITTLRLEISNGTKLLKGTQIQMQVLYK